MCGKDAVCECVVVLFMCVSGCVSILRFRVDLYSFGVTTLHYHWQLACSVNA